MISMEVYRRMLEDDAAKCRERRMISLEVYRRMLSVEVDAAKCRERRHRRIVMRRLATIPSTKANSPSPSSSHNRKENQTKSFGLEKKHVWKMDGKGAPKISSSLSKEDVKTVDVVPSPLVFQPQFGTMSVCGRSRKMEDAISASTCLFGPKNCWWREMHFFGVYDGHGGDRVAKLCKEKMHVLVHEELVRVVGKPEMAESGGGGSRTMEEEATWIRVMRRSFERMDEVALTTCACGRVTGRCECHPLSVALCGSTAVFAALTPDHIIVANCGDSRAVLCRGGRTIPLSNDHKPDRIDELKRIEAAGGRVIFVNGARVEGILAMSRAIGDKYLKSVVVSEPEITFTKRESDDECLILASDGLWDVLSSEMACEVTRECLYEGTITAATIASIDLNAVPQIEEEGAGTLYLSRTARAAALLTRLALARKSRDNISVIIVDLKRT